jgi:hypothetical protein
LVAFNYLLSCLAIGDIAKGAYQGAGSAAYAALWIGGDYSFFVSGKGTCLTDFQARGIVTLKAGYGNLPSIFEKYQVNLGRSGKKLGPVPTGTGKFAVYASYALGGSYLYGFC